MKGTNKRAAALAAVLAGGSLLPCARADSIGINFSSGKSGSTYALSSTQSAGVVPQTGWNNLTGTTGTNAPVYTDTNSTQTTADATVSYSANGNYTAPNANSGPNYTLYEGYLDATTTNSAITVSGLGTAFTSGGYDVIVYFDGSNGTASRIGHYQLTPTGGSALNLYGNDAASASFSGTFLESTATSDPGTSAPDSNYVRFTGLTAGSFTLAGVLDGTAADGTKRSPINAIQIVAVPEPASLGILGVAATALPLRRRRKSR